MYLLFVSVALVIGLALGGDLSHLAQTPVKGLGWIVCSFTIRAASSFLSGKVPGSPAIYLAVSVTCYALLVIGILQNLRLPGSRIMLAGAAMNAIVVISNGGRMPVNLSLFSEEVAAAQAVRLATSLTHQALTSGGAVTFLSDLFLCKIPPFKASVFSAGDVTLALGSSFLVLAALLRGFPTPAGDGTIGSERSGAR